MKPAQRLAAVAALLALAAAAPARGATLHWSTDFESGLPVEMTAPGSVLAGVQGWSGLGPAGNQFGGQFLRYTSVPLYDTRLVLRNLPAHTHVSVGFLLALIDSWDGVELFQVEVDGVQGFSHWFQLATGDTSNYPPPPGALLSAGTNLGFTNGTWYFHDRAYDLSVEPAFQDIPHTADSLVVAWKLGAVSGPAATQWQGGSDESWAIDNVRVYLSNTTDAPAPQGPHALALAGAQPNPSRDGRLRVRLALPSGAEARLDLFDVTGRRLTARDVGALGAGQHVVDLGEGRFPPGLYLLRLTQDGITRTARAVVTH